MHYVAQFYITSNPDDEKMDNVIESIDVLFKDEKKTEQVPGMYKTRISKYIPRVENDVKRYLEIPALLFLECGNMNKKV